MYLSYDPGKTTGWAKFADDGSAQEYGQVDLDDLLMHCEIIKHNHQDDPVRALIVEDFVLFKHKAQQQTGSKMEAAQAIGILKALASAVGCPFILQDPKIKKIAAMQTQVFPTGAHKNTHWVDAFNHGAYWLIEQGIRKTQLEMDNEKKT